MKITSFKREFDTETFEPFYVVEVKVPMTMLQDLSAFKAKEELYSVIGFEFLEQLKEKMKENPAS